MEKELRIYKEVLVCHSIILMRNKFNTIFKTSNLIL